MFPPKSTDEVPLDQLHAEINRICSEMKDPREIYTQGPKLHAHAMATNHQYRERYTAYFAGFMEKQRERIENGEWELLIVIERRRLAAGAAQPPWMTTAAAKLWQAVLLAPDHTLYEKIFKGALKLVACNSEYGTSTVL